jgi:3-oxoadipate CoA-transferase, beta subunit
MTPVGWSLSELAQIVAGDLPDGSYVNLGIGMPNLVADSDVATRGVQFHSENGVLGLGPRASAGHPGPPDLIDAGKHPVTLHQGAAFFGHADSFAMIRSGRINVAVMGAFQVSAAGDLANWWTGEPGTVPAVGGAMDLAYGAQEVWVMCRHLTPNGHPKLVEQCTYPLTGRRCVTRVYTDLAVVRVMDDGFAVIRTPVGMSPDDVPLPGRVTAA